MAKVEKHSISHEEGIIFNKKIDLVEGQGILGDKSFGKTERQVCLVDSKVFEQLKTKYKDGLCVKKFNANIFTNGINYEEMEVGDRFKVGTAEIEIISVGKRCFSECQLIQNKTPCPLPKSCAFAKVVKSGYVHINDDIFPI